MNAGGIRLSKTRGIALSGNVFASVHPKAVAVEQPTTHVLFGNNVLIDVESDHLTLQKSVIKNNITAPAEPAKETTEKE